MILQVLNTVKYLKCSQIKGQILNRLKKKISVEQSDNNDLNIRKLFFSKYIDREDVIYSNKCFIFLNQEKCFHNEIDWNFLGYGKLWNYNLEYFDCLQQINLGKNEKTYLIESFYSFSVINQRVLEPYPVSLRAINIIKYVLKEEQYTAHYIGYLYKELSFLDKNYEFHLLGNHLLENAFALCLGGAFFNKEVWRDKAIKILSQELDKQILEDGAHFELSPMYHNIIFFRLLELIDWYSKYDKRDSDFLLFCRHKASLMLDWLENIRFRNGNIPLFNDAAQGIAFDYYTLMGYAAKLGVERKFISLGVSGYRSFENDLYEIKIDLAQIGASYQPGHAHADSLSFILYYRGEPLFVEQGTSTYQIGERRNLERSTEAHNTVVVDKTNQSDVWGGFRVGNRAKTTIHQETSNSYEASHDGYKKFGIIHNRTFLFNEKEVQVMDKLSKKGNAKFYLHIHPDRILIQIDAQRFLIDDNILILIDGAISIKIEDYDYAETYNQYRSAKRLVVSFTDNLHTAFSFKD